MIISFADKNTEQLYINGKSKKYQKSVVTIGIKKLDYINAAESLEDLRIPPGNKLELLKGNYTGKYSIRINQQFRIVFRYDNSNAYEVEIIDYH